MWRNDIKCKYMFIFTLKNLARKRFIGPLWTNFSKIWIKFQTFYWSKCISKCCVRNGSHIVQASGCSSCVACISMCFFFLSTVPVSMVVLVLMASIRTRVHALLGSQAPTVNITSTPASRGPALMAPPVPIRMGLTAATAPLVLLVLAVR